MQTEWHNYKSSTRKRVVGAYGYCPDYSEDNLVHVYEGAGRFVAFYHVKALSTLSGPIIGANTLGDAKAAAMRVIANHIKGQGSLQLRPDF